jgi:hypothetical protein
LIRWVFVAAVLGTLFGVLPAVFLSIETGRAPWWENIQ